MEFAGGGQVYPLLRGGRDASAASALDGVGCVVMVGGWELAKLFPKLARQVFLVKREPAVCYRGFKRTDSIFFVLVLFVIHDSAFKAVALVHRTERMVG